MVPVLPQERRQLRQRRWMVVGVDRAIEAIAQQRSEIVRKAVGIDALALDETRVAVGSLLGRPAPVDEKNRACALLQVERHTDPDDACAEHHHVTAHYVRSGRRRPFYSMSYRCNAISKAFEPVSPHLLQIPLDPLFERGKTSKRNMAATKRD